MNETNRAVIVLLAGLWILLMAVLIFLAWAADADVVDRLGDFVEYLDAHRDNPSRLILTLGALVTVVLALLLIIVELAPEEEVRELKVEQAGATTIVPADALRARLEEALVGLPQVSAAKARVMSKDRGIGTALTLTITPDTNVAFITQEASRVVVDTIQSDLGLPVAAPPTVRILFGGPKAAPVASSVVQAPQPQPSPPLAAGGDQIGAAYAPEEAAAPPAPSYLETPPPYVETPLSAEEHLPPPAAEPEPLFGAPEHETLSGEEPAEQRAEDQPSEEPAAEPRRDEEETPG